MAERPGVLRVNDRVVFAGTTHTVVAISGAAIRLVSTAGATTVVALPYLLGAVDFELVGAAPAPRVDPHGLLEALPAQVGALLTNVRPGIKKLINAAGMALRVIATE